MCPKGGASALHSLEYSDYPGGQRLETGVPGGPLMKGGGHLEWVASPPGVGVWKYDLDASLLIGIPRLRIAR